VLQEDIIIGMYIYTVETMINAPVERCISHTSSFHCTFGFSVNGRTNMRVDAGCAAAVVGAGFDDIVYDIYIYLYNDR
jgi:hypothetical protein